MSSPYRILFVCLGNICRSPAGENVMRHLINHKGLTNISVNSAGTAGYHIGKSPDQRMCDELKSRDIPVTGSAQQFEKKHFDEYDLIIPMDHSNEKNILRLARNIQDREKVTPFMRYCSEFTNTEVPDPYYDGQDAFALVVDIMLDGCKGILDDVTNA